MCPVICSITTNMAYKDHNKALEYWRQYNAKRRVKKPKTARQQAIENNEPFYFTGKPCVRGHIAKRNTKLRVCFECINVLAAIKRAKNPERISELKKADYKKHREAYLAQKRSYRQANKGKITALNALRKEVIKQRTPEWLTEDDFWLIREVYDLAALRTKMFGFSWHVDHIVPLQGKLVSGLHVPINLQVIPGIENIKKKNKYEVNYAK